MVPATLVRSSTLPVSIPAVVVSSVERQNMGALPWEENIEEQLSLGIGPDVRKGIPQIVEAATAKQELQKDSWREACRRFIT
jgi:hypothetical protein